MNNFWNTVEKTAYNSMYKRHYPLHSWLKEFIKEKGIESIFEIGGGTINAGNHYVKDYIAVDINENADAIHEDFKTIDVSQFKKRFDLVLSCSVIEHNYGYEEFLEQIVRLKPKYAVISFFNGLDRPESKIIPSKIDGKTVYWRP